MPKYKDEPLVRRSLPDDHPCAQESQRLAAMPSVYEPDESKTFYENLRLKYIFDLRKQTLREIKELKALFLKETGEPL
jgi:hypothetical protein